MASHASSSERLASRSTKTGMKVAESTPPSTRSKMMLGVLLARLYESASGPMPSAYANTNSRAKPVSLDRRVPTAMAPVVRDSAAGHDTRDPGRLGPRGGGTGGTAGIGSVSSLNVRAAPAVGCAHAGE